MPSDDPNREFKFLKEVEKGYLVAGTEVTVVCKGFTVVSDTDLTYNKCLRNGTWQNAFPTCFPGSRFRF